MLEYHQKKSDRAITPRRPDFNRLYNTYCQERFGARNGTAMFETLNSKICDYVQNNKGANIKFQEFSETESEVIPFIVTILTPLMARVHTMVRNHF